MVDKDMFLDAEEKQLLEKSYEHEKQKELTPSADLKKELNPIHAVPLLKTK